MSIRGVATPMLDLSLSEPALALRGRLIFFIYTQNGYVRVNVNSPKLGQGLGLAGRPVVAVNVNSY